MRFESEAEKSTVLKQLHERFDRLDAIIKDLAVLVAKNDERLKGSEKLADSVQKKLDEVVHMTRGQDVEIARIQARHGVMTAIAGALGLGGIFRP